jgi:hypothetical protein
MQCLPPDELIRHPSPLPEWWNTPVDWKQSNIDDHRKRYKNIGRHRRASGELMRLALDYIKRRKNGRWVGIGELRRAFSLPCTSYLTRSLQRLVSQGELDAQLMRSPRPEWHYRIKVGDK